MDSTYSQRFKLRWGTLLFAALVVFVLLANARQTQPETETAQVPAAEAPATVALAEPGPEATTLREDSPPSIENAVPFATQEVSLPLVEDAEDADDGCGATVNCATILVSRGDTLSGILDRFNVHSSLGRLLKIRKKIAPLMNLKPGNPLHLVVKDGELISLSYEHSPTEHLEITLDGESYAVANRVLPIEKRETHAFGVVESSFYRAGMEAGLSDRTIINMANILGWDIDFVLDVRRGDQFSVVYEEEFLNGEKLRDGRVHAVEFINRGKTYRALWYTGPDGKSDYFSPAGKSMRKPFLRNPIEYARVSSHFNPRRLHPIFKTVRPHRGVDYAAPTGTPIRSSGDGKVTFVGRKAGYGNVIIVQHGRVYSTLYAHLSKFARGLRRGNRVRQAQVIGYVGSTGYSTGPHLHYEFRVNGVHKNPLTVKLPDSTPLPKSKMAHFKQAVAPALAKLNTLNGAYVAANSRR